MLHKIHKTRYVEEKAPVSEKYFYFYILNTGWASFLHELVYRFFYSDDQDWGTAEV